MIPPLTELLSTLLYSLNISVCRTFRSSGGSSLMNTAVPPTTIAVGIQFLPLPSFTGKSHMSFSSCKNLAGILRQETSRSEGSGVACVLEVEAEVLFEDCVRAGSGEIPCARLATGDNVKKSIEAAAMKCTRPKE